MMIDENNTNSGRTMMVPSQLFENTIFRVPNYQRGYAWEQPQLDDFWNDIERLQKGKFHYTGLLTLRKFKQGDFLRLGVPNEAVIRIKPEGYYLVDGQQRLATLIILISEIVDHVRNLPENKKKEDREICIERDPLDVIVERYFYRIISNNQLGVFGYTDDEISDKFFQKEVLRTNIDSEGHSYYTRQVSNAKDYFREKIKNKSNDEIKDIYQKITERFKFNIYVVEDDYNENIAFETINNRGKKLSELELLKNRLLYITSLFPENILSSSESEEWVECINSNWKTVYEYIGKNENKSLLDQDLLRDYSRIRGEYKRDYLKELFKIFSYDRIQDDSNVADLKEEIINYAKGLGIFVKCWYYTYFPNEIPKGYASIEESERNWLIKLNHVGPGMFRALIALTLRENLKFKKGNRLDFYKNLERFIFVIQRIGRDMPSSFKTDYNNQMKAFYDNCLNSEEDDPSVFLKSISDKLNNDTEINKPQAINDFLNWADANFKTYTDRPCNGYYFWSGLHHFLYEYECYLEDGSEVATELSWEVWPEEDRERISVEHIYPQDPRPLYWRNEFRQFKPNEKNILNSTIGNLLLLPKGDNSVLSDKPFSEKKKIYENGSRAEKEVAMEDNWDAIQIHKRGMKLLEFMKERWNLGDEFKKIEEQLLGLSFINDDRYLPPEIDLGHPLSGIYRSETQSLKELISDIFANWGEVHKRSGDIIYDENQWPQNNYYRFHTRELESVIPEAKESLSEWNTKSYYYFEIKTHSSRTRNDATVQFQLALNNTRIPKEIKDVFERLKEKLGFKWGENDNGRYAVPFGQKEYRFTKETTIDDIGIILEDISSTLRDWQERIMAILRYSPQKML